MSTEPNTKADILVVDDTPSNLDILREILSPEFRVRLCTNGQQAITLAKKSPPDLMLLDIMMPEMDGYEVCQKLKQDPQTADIPVIFVTAMSEMQDEKRGFEVGAVDYITKPINHPEIILARIRTHLLLHNQMLALESKVKARTAELQQAQKIVIQCLGKASEFKDNETGLHVIRTSYYARFIAEEFKLNERQCDLIYNAMPMHDVGKIGIADRILLKNGRLDNEERHNMEEHVHIGVEILGHHEESELLRTASLIAQTHHEKWDGSGYPNGLQEEAIPLFGRIAAIADVFDALTSPRPYKNAWTIQEAVDYIHENAGTHFDPGLIPAFDSALPKIEKIRVQYLESSAE